MPAVVKRNLNITVQTATAKTNSAEPLVTEITIPVRFVPNVRFLQNHALTDARLTIHATDAPNAKPIPTATCRQSPVPTAALHTTVVPNVLPAKRIPIAARRRFLVLTAAPQPTPAASVSHARAIRTATSVPNPAITVALLTTVVPNVLPAKRIPIAARRRFLVLTAAPQPTPAASVSHARAIRTATSVPNPAITVALLTTPATSAFPVNPVRHTQMRQDVLTEVTLVLTDAAVPEPVVRRNRLILAHPFPAGLTHIVPAVPAIVIPVMKAMLTAAAPRRIPVPASAAPRTRAALTDVLLTPVLHPVVRLFVPLVNRHRNRSPVPPPARVLLQNRVHRLNLSSRPNLLKLNAEKCIRTIMSVSGVAAVVRYVTTDLSVCRLPVMTIFIKKPAAHHGNGKRAYR